MCQTCPFNPETKVLIFSNGSEYERWQDKNCRQCKQYKTASKTKEKASCKMAFAMDYAYLGDGKITLAEAKEVGCSYNPLYQQAELHQRCKRFANIDDKNSPW